MSGQNIPSSGIITSNGVSISSMSMPSAGYVKSNGSSFSSVSNIPTSDLTGSINITNGGTGANNASDARTNLGLKIGTDIQAYNGALQSISGLSTSADQMLYTTGSNTYNTTSLTSFGRSFVANNNVSDAVNMLNLGSANFVEFKEIATNAGTSSSGVIHHYFTNGPSLRFGFGLYNTESGSNTGSDLGLWTYNDSGLFINSAMTIVTILLILLMLLHFQSIINKI